MGHSSSGGEIPQRPQLPEGYRRRVVLRFRPDFNLPYEDDVQDDLPPNILDWGDVTGTFHHPLTLDRAFSSLTEAELSQLDLKASSANPSRRLTGFRRYYQIECPNTVNPEQLAAKLEQFPVVERAYVATDPMAPPVDARFEYQDYLDPSPGGVDAKAGWGRMGGDGAGVDFVDIEQGWVLNHEDLKTVNITLLSGQNTDWRGHGTAVLGIVMAPRNEIGCIGVAPACNGFAVSQWRQRGRKSAGYNTEDALVSLASRNPGTIVLIESQTTGYLPMEVEDAVYLAVEALTSIGIVVVACAGNGNLPLDSYTNGLGQAILDRSSTQFRDSAAILVGGARAASAGGLAGGKCYPTNYGSRVDCCAWGETVVTTGDGATGTNPHDYTAAFGGTSAAAAIVAGVAVSAQGISLAELKRPLTPREMRGLLRDQGIASPDPIGFMPDLARIASHLVAGVALTPF
jgi:hypothetical protein